MSENPGKKVLADVAGFDKGGLKTVETAEKQVLPDKDVIVQEKTEAELRSEIEKGKSMKHVETTEKNVLPSKEAIAREKTEVELRSEIEKGKDMKHVETSEKNPLPTMEGKQYLEAALRSYTLTTIAQEKTETELRSEIEKGKAMKHVETSEKNPLPSKEAIAQEKTEVELRTQIEKGKDLKHVETSEKNPLPTKEDIATEKRLSSS